MKILLLPLLGVVLFCEPTKASNWYDSVLVRADNGYVTYYDSISPLRKAPDVIIEWCKKICPDNLMGRNQIFETSYNDVTLYSIRYSGIGFEEYYILAYDSLSNSLSSSPFVINGKWSANNESGFDIPILRGEMMEIRENDILFRERVHNGTSYNAVLLYCLSCNDSLDFKIKYCIEECSLCTTPEMSIDEYYIIEREVTPELQVVSIGDVCFVGVPGELCNEYGLEIKWHSPFRKAFIAYVSTAYLHYICQTNLVVSGGYEGDCQVFSTRDSVKFLQTAADAMFALRDEVFPEDASHEDPYPDYIDRPLVDIPKNR